MPISSSAILQIIRRELNQSLVGELQSSHAQAVGALIDEALRHIIARLEIEQDLVRELTDAYAELHSNAGETHPRSPDGTHWDHQERWTRALAVAGSVETDLLRHLREDVSKKPRLSPLTDPLCLQALAAEHALLRKSIEFERALQHPTHSPEQLAQLEVTPERLAPVLAKLLPDRRDIRNVRIVPSLGGFSKETFLVDFESSRGTESVALRRDNPHGPVDSTVLDEFHLLQALYKAGQPVPEPLALETDARALGHPFLITRKMPGGTVPNTRGIAVGPEHIRTLLALAEFLARLHSTDPRTLGLPRAYFKPELSLRDVLLNDLDRWEAACRSEIERAPLTITSVFEWLRLNVPDEPVKLALVHGDAGPHNMLMDGGKVTAVLDWELAHAGDPCEDLTYCRMWIDQIMPFEDFLQHYYRHGGPEYSADRGKYYATFIHARHITTSIRAYVGMAHAPHPHLSALIAMIRYGRMFELAAAEDIADLSH
ncbi:MAG: phosphotransferase family protein [Steroidobacteraceae bacterium]